MSEESRSALPNLDDLRDRRRGSPSLKPREREIVDEFQNCEQTWLKAGQLADRLGYSSSQIGGRLGVLHEKGLIEPFGEPKIAGGTAWRLTEAGGNA